MDSRRTRHLATYPRPRTPLPDHGTPRTAQHPETPRPQRHTRRASRRTAHGDHPYRISQHSPRRPPLTPSRPRPLPPPPYRPTITQIPRSAHTLTDYAIALGDQVLVALDPRPTAGVPLDDVDDQCGIHRGLDRHPAGLPLALPGMAVTEAEQRAGRTVASCGRRPSG